MGLLFSFFSFQKASAQDTKLPTLTPPDLSVSLPGIDTLRKVSCTGDYMCKIPWIGQYIVGIQRYAIGIVGIIAVIVLMIGGVIWLTAAGNPNQVAHAKKMIFGSLMGLFLVFGSYIILNLINPNLTTFKALNIEYVNHKDMDKIEMTDEEIDLANQLLEQQSSNEGSGNSPDLLGQGPLEIEGKKMGRGLCSDVENPDRSCTEFIVVHTTVDNKTAVQVDKYEREGTEIQPKGFKCISYNRFVQRDSTVVDGRADEGFGGHAPCYNDRSVGIVYSGCSSGPRGQYTRLEQAGYFDTFDMSWSFMKIPPEPTRIILKPQLLALLNEIKRVQTKYNIGIENVLGHHETGRIKDCPCVNMDDIRLVLTAENSLNMSFEQALFTLPTLRKFATGYTTTQYTAKGYMRNINKSWPRLVDDWKKCCYPKNDPPATIGKNGGCINGPVVNNCYK